MKNYPILTEWLNNNLKERFDNYKQNIINAHPELSPNWAGCLAARILELEFNTEFNQVYQCYAKKDDSEEWLNFVDDCNFYLEDHNFRLDLIEWSGTRWYETDEEINRYMNAAKGLEANKLKDSEEKRKEFIELAKKGIRSKYDY